ncbi:MAG: DUF1062 domain-containing protein [Defluviitaleaceae bacterium]|nr:DUF1062 domain-containing protein [Defluviitaleaceae bacterium]
MNHNEVTWRIFPLNTPTIIRHCSKCNRKMDFYCSEKFRTNSNQTRSDIWLIYKCEKCDTTLKLAIKKGIKPSDLPKERFDKFTNNDVALAWEYAFNCDFLKNHNCVINYASVKYRVDGIESIDLEKPLYIHLKSDFVFDLKLSGFLASTLNLSVTKIKRLAEMGNITTNPECNIAKHKIKSDMEILIHTLSSPLLQPLLLNEPVQ